MDPYPREPGDRQTTHSAGLERSLSQSGSNLAVPCLGCQPNSLLNPTVKAHVRDGRMIQRIVPRSPWTLPLSRRRSRLTETTGAPGGVDRISQAIFFALLGTVI